MGSPTALDLEAIRRPIAGAEPAGPNLREDASPSSSYYRLKEARSAARLAERAAETPEKDKPPKPADWGLVLELGRTILQSESKDLEVAAWTTEALCRLDGFAGLSEGFQAMRVLAEGFWDGLWPRPDDDGMSTRLAALSGLNGEDAPGTLVAPIGNVPITNGNGSALALWHYQKALEIRAIPDSERRERAAAAAGVTLESFQRAVAETPREFFQELTASLQASLGEFDRLNHTLEGLCRAAAPPAEAPPSSNIRNALSEVLEAVQNLAKDKLSAPESTAVASSGAGDATGLGSSPPAPVPGGALSREAAFQMLVRVSEYFRKTEPHSPLSYSLEQAVRWGRMPLPDLLGELIPDEGARNQYMKLAGIPAPKKE
jgi:type VI secretion system protein ImpA